MEIIVLTTKHPGWLICEYLWYLCDLYKHSGWISCEYLSDLSDLCDLISTTRMAYL